MYSFAPSRCGLSTCIKVLIDWLIDSAFYTSLPGFADGISNLTELNSLIIGPTRWMFLLMKRATHMPKYTVYFYSSILQFVNCNKFTKHSKLAAARREICGGGVNFSAARRRGSLTASSITLHLLSRGQMVLRSENFRHHPTLSYKV